jgi:hypothetical protein
MYIAEILAAAEDNISSILAHKDNSYLRAFLSAAYIPEKKMKLPEGMPPHNSNKQEDAQVPPGVFWQFARKVDIFSLPGTNPIRMEQQFIQQLESVSATEAKIMVAAKDQELHKLYKGVTYDALKTVGYFV